MAPFVLAALHPFHVSVCEIEVNQEARSVQVSQRIFLDDFEDALNSTYATSLIIDDSARKGERDSLIQLYLFDHLKILVDGKEKKPNYLGSEFEEDGIWCYIEYEGIKKVKSLEVTSTVLLNQFDDQANIIHYIHEGYEKSVKLDDKNLSVTFVAPKIR